MQASRVPAPENRPEWKMSATAYVASLVVKNMYCKLEYGSDCNTPPPPNFQALKAWASKDGGW